MCSMVAHHPVREFQPQLHCWEKRKFCITDTGEAVLYGITRPDTPPVIHKYNCNGELQQSWPAPKCGHILTPRGGSYQQIFHLCIQDVPYVLVSCCHYECNSMTLYDTTRHGRVTIAYSNPGKGKYSPGRMCKGPAGTLLAVNTTKGSHQVIVFDSRSMPFTVKDTIPMHGMEPTFISYMETGHTGGMVIASKFSRHIINAISFKDKHLIWRLQGDVMGSMISPHSMSPDNNERLYVSDGSNERILVLDGSSGCMLQVIQLQELGTIWRVAWCDKQPHLIFFHGRHKQKYLISYFNVEFCSSV